MEFPSQALSTVKNEQFTQSCQSHVAWRKKKTVENFIPLRTKKQGSRALTKTNNNKITRVNFGSGEPYRTFCDSPHPGTWFLLALGKQGQVRPWGGHGRVEEAARYLR